MPTTYLGALAFIYHMVVIHDIVLSSCYQNNKGIGTMDVLKGHATELLIVVVLLLVVVLIAALVVLTIRTGVRTGIRDATRELDQQGRSNERR